MPLFLLHRLRTAINWAATPLGFAIERIPKRKWHHENSILETKVGRFVIQIPGINPLSWHYDVYPEFGGQLGCLTSVVKKKYPQLAVIDVGANVGDTACIIKTAEDVPVLCIEGDDKTFIFLQKNLAQFQNTTAHKLFLGEKTGVIAAAVEKTGWNTTINPGTAQAKESIRVVRLDEFIVTQPAWENFKLLKIDTEGFDCAILRGSTNYLRQVSPVIFFEYNRENMDAIGEPGLDTLFGLAELGYSRIAFHDNAGRLVAATTLDDREVIKDLHGYADGKNAEIYYYDLTVFHERDTDLAMKFLEIERARRIAAQA
jgi:FkbM family methyltransferase